MLAALAGEAIASIKAMPTTLASAARRMFIDAQHTSGTWLCWTYAQVAMLGRLYAAALRQRHTQHLTLPVQSVHVRRTQPRQQRCRAPNRNSLTRRLHHCQPAHGLEPACEASCNALIELEVTQHVGDSVESGGFHV